GECLGHGPAAELAELVTEPGDDRRVAVTVDEPGHHEPVSQIEGLGARGRRRTVGWTDGHNAVAVDHDRRIAERRRSDAVEQCAAADRTNAHCPCPPGHEYPRSALTTRPGPRQRCR